MRLTSYSQAAERTEHCWKHLVSEKHDEVFSELSADPKRGLSSQEAKARLDKYGPSLRKRRAGHTSDVS